MLALLAPPRGKKRTKEEFDALVYHFVLLVLRSGVGSFVSTMEYRRNTWIVIFIANGYTYEFPSLKTLQENCRGNFLWSNKDVNAYIASLFTGGALPGADAAMEALGMTAGETAKYGSYKATITILRGKCPMLKQHMKERFSAAKDCKQAKRDFVTQLSRYLKKRVNPVTLMLNAHFMNYKQLHVENNYNHVIESETTRAIVELSHKQGKAMALPISSSNFDIAIINYVMDGTDEDKLQLEQLLLEESSTLLVTKRIELKQCANPQVDSKQFKMIFCGAFEHADCAGFYAFQYINSEYILTTFAVLVVESIETLRKAAGREKDDAWAVHLSELKLSDEFEKVSFFKWNAIFDSIMAKMTETNADRPELAFKLCTGDNALEDAVRWLQALPDDKEPTLLHEAESDSTSVNKGNEGERNMRTCVQSVFVGAKRQQTTLVTNDREDARYLFDDGIFRSFSSKTVRMQGKCFNFLMTHRVDGMQDTPFTMEKACDVLCASASGEVLAGLVEKFKPDANADVNATAALFVFAKKAIVCGKTAHTITGACFRDNCIMLKADRTPCDLVKAKLVFRKVFAQNAKKTDSSSSSSSSSS